MFGLEKAIHFLLGIPESDGFESRFITCYVLPY
jgi:hypothetical protein